MEPTQEVLRGRRTNFGVGEMLYLTHIGGGGLVSILIILRSCFNLMTADYLTTTLKQFGSRVTASCPTIMRYFR